MQEWDLIFSYTRKQAIEDGVLIEVPKELMEEVGIRFPIVYTTGVSTILDQDRLYEDVHALLLVMAVAICKLKGEPTRVDFKFKGEPMYALCHPDDDGVTPVITIMLIGED